MAQTVYRGNLSAAKFPLVSTLQGRTIIVPQYDNVYVPVVASKADDDKDRGIPQIYYCHNVVGTENGFQTIGYRKRILATVNTAFHSYYNLRIGTAVYGFSHNTDGTNWIYDGTGWTQINSVGGAAITTIAYISGETYIYFAGIGCYRYNPGTNTLVVVALAGLVAADILGITSASGYLIAWGVLEVAWSSTVDPTDFVPSLTTGAGGGSVEQARGKLNVCAPHALGFMVYTDSNVVAAIYSGNARYPFNFREVNGTGGCKTLDLISWDSNAAAHYAYTGSGLQFISLAATTSIYPEVTDFLAGSYFEDFDEATKLLGQSRLTSVLLKRLTAISDRYLVISYGILKYTHALVIDLVNKRFGKLKFTHVACFEWSFSAPEVQETPKDSFALLQSDGTVSIVDFSEDNPNAYGVLILGKHQFVRSRLLQLQEVEVENITPGGQFSFYDMVSLDGKNTILDTGYLAYNSGKLQKYNFDEVGINHSLLWMGAFHAVSYVMHFNIHGRI